VLHGRRNEALVMPAASGETPPFLLLHRAVPAPVSPFSVAAWRSLSTPAMCASTWQRLPPPLPGSCCMCILSGRGVLC
jgi:hypothetical protein